MELAHQFKTNKTLSPISTDLEGIYLLKEGPIRDPKIGYVYMKKSWNKKDFFRVRDRHLVPTTILQKFISKTDKIDIPEEINNQFVKKHKWYIEVRSWMQKAYLFLFEESKQND